jgi:UTP--glucose-1-phosphate uridylyltransferase
LIKNAIVPVAGLGTRLLPATKSQPKEMLPVGKKPVVQYVVEELARSGLREILFVTGRGKDSIENHFDRDPELIESLRTAAKDDLLDELHFEELKIHYLYTRQSVQRGLGDAILCGEPFVGHDPFVVALGDSIIGLNGESTICRRMCDVYEETQAAAVIGVEEVARETVSHYGVVKPDNGGEVFNINTLVEKPKPEDAPSNLAIAGRYVFSPVIFDMIRRVSPDKRQEIQLTDAIRMLCETGRRVMGVRLSPEERRYDIGNFQSYFETFVEFALADAQYGPRLRERLRQLLGT